MEGKPVKKLNLCFVALLACVCWFSAGAAQAALTDPAQIQTEAYVNLVQADQSLDRAAKQALDCACSKAHRGFRSAAVYARRARIARDTQQFSSALNRSFHEFDAANRALRRCGRNS